MDDLFDFLVELLMELFRWEDLDRSLRKRIPNRLLRGCITTLIYILSSAVMVAVLAGFFRLFSKLI